MTFPAKEAYSQEQPRKPFLSSQHMELPVAQRISVYSLHAMENPNCKKNRWMNKKLNYSIIAYISSLTFAPDYIEILH